MSANTELEKNRDKLISYTIRDKQSLYMSYMPFLKNGGLFVPSKKEYKMGEKIFLLITLMDIEEPIKISGKVVWINPNSTLGNRPRGIGIEFSEEEAKEICSKIKDLLGNALKLDKQTYTM